MDLTQIKKNKITALGHENNYLKKKPIKSRLIRNLAHYEEGGKGGV